MAALQSFTFYQNNQALAANKVMAYIQNNHASEVIKIWRCGLLNAQTAAVTGVICMLEARFCTAATFTGAATTGCTVQLHDTNNTAPTTYAYGTATTITPTASQPLRRVFWSSDEPKLTTAQNNELETVVPLNIIFDAGYGDTNVQPLTLRNGNCFYIVNTTGAAGLLDVWIEFTKE